jgi:hypothetical protein
MTVGDAERGVVDAPGARLAYDAAGQGLGLVLVHAGICDRGMEEGAV